MKNFILAVIIICSFGNIYSQVTLPSNYLKKSMIAIEQKKSSAALTDSSNTSSKPKFYFLPTLKNIDFFEKDSTRFFQKNVVSYNDSLSNISLYSEIASDFIGPVRVSAGITFAYPKTDSSSVEQKKLIGIAFFKNSQLVEEH